MLQTMYWLNWVRYTAAYQYPENLTVKISIWISDIFNYPEGRTGHHPPVKFPTITGYTARLDARSILHILSG